MRSQSFLFKWCRLDRKNCYELQWNYLDLSWRAASSPVFIYPPLHFFSRNPISTNFLITAWNDGVLVLTEVFNIYSVLIMSSFGSFSKARNNLICEPEFILSNATVYKSSG